jgi:hypothetical protein
MTDPRFVMCMKWGSKYGPEYVNRLYGDGGAATCKRTPSASSA